MRMLSAIVLVALLVQSPRAVAAGQPLIRTGDTVALIGGTMIESLQDRGDCEVAVVLSRPDLRVPFRNLGWSGDDVHGSARRVFGTPDEGYARLMRDIAVAGPTVAVIGYGFAESSNGPRGVADFQQGLRRLAADLESEGIRRVFLMPFALEGVRTEGYEQAVEQCREIVRRFAEQQDAPLIDPAAAVRSLGSAAFDASGLRLSAKGKAVLGQEIAAGLLGVAREQLAADLDPALYAQLSAMVGDKNALFFHRYRPMNETYLFLFRKHEQGNNAAEVGQFEPLVERAEQAIWERAMAGSR